jgi:hypothetical protein
VSTTLQPLLRLVSPTPRPDPSRPEHLNNQDTLRSVGAWLDIRGYTLVAVRRDGDALIVEATLPHEEAPEVLRFDREALARLSFAARSDRNRDDRPPIYPVFD